MKRILVVLTLAATCISFSAETSAQDLITKKDGNEIKAKVLEIDNGNVRYRLFDEPEGVIYTIRKNDILVMNTRMDERRFSLSSRDKTTISLTETSMQIILFLE